MAASAPSTTTSSPTPGTSRGIEGPVVPSHEAHAAIPQRKWPSPPTPLPTLGEGCLLCRRPPRLRPTPALLARRGHPAHDTERSSPPARLDTLTHEVRANMSDPRLHAPALPPAEHRA